MKQHLSYSPSFNHHTAEILRGQLVNGVRFVPHKHVCFLTLLEAFAGNVVNNTDETILYVLVDLEMIYVLVAEGDGRQLASTVEALREAYPFHPIDALASYQRTHGPIVLFPVQSQVIDFLCRNLPPGGIATISLRCGEIHRSQATAIGSICDTRYKESSDVLTAKSLSPLSVGIQAERGAMPALEELVSYTVGIVRSEYLELSDTGLPTATCKLSWDNKKPQIACGGRSFRREDAIALGRCETLERYQLFFPRNLSELRWSSYVNLQFPSIDPHNLFFSRARHRGGGYLDTYEPTKPMYWARATDFQSGADFYVPAQEIWINTGSLPDETLFIASSSSGCALGASLPEAATYALFEAIERDAYLLMWYLKRPCRVIDPRSIPAESFQLLLRKTEAVFPNFEISFLDLTADIRVPVVLCVASKKDGKGPAVLHSCACRPRVAAAAMAALKDLYLNKDHHYGSKGDDIDRRILENEEDVMSPLDHRSVYSNLEARSRLDFLVNAASAQMVTAQEVEEPCSISHEASAPGQLAAAAREFERLKMPLLFRDLTHRQSEARGAWLVKAVTPGLLPMWYGYWSVRVSVTPRLQRLAQQYVGLKLESIDQLNLMVHPFC